MITDIDSIKKFGEHLFDFCIIGAGAAGITLAMELKDKGFSIALLESGNNLLEWETQQLYETETTGIPRQPQISTRLRFFGGTTNHWDGRCGPLSESDFSERDWVPHSGWPITRTELDPYYKRATQYIDINSESFDYTSLKEKNIPLPTLGDDWNFHVWQYSAPTRFGLKYVQPLKEANNVHVYFNANVTNILLNNQGTEVSTVKVASLKGFSRELRAKKFILSCGGIENARILLNANSQMSEGLGNQNDLVGRYFMEHLRTKLVADVTGNPYALNQTYNEYTWQNRRYLLGLEATPKLLQEKEILNSGCWMEYVPNTYSPTRSFTHIVGGNTSGSSFFLHAKEALMGAQDIYLNIRRKLIAPGAPMIDKSSNTIVIETEQAPNPNSRITLTNTIDALGQAVANIHWEVTGLDLETSRKASLAIAQKFTKDHGIRIKTPEWMNNVNDDAKPSFTDVAHHMGTTRMSRNPQQGVVDAQCKVFGINNLYIAGSSVFPTSGHVNPTMTIVALAIRLSDHLTLNGIG
ncbi:GMC oxidoreductase [Reinekea sp.]|jgi:choline dehydrogenase-like flavoprotein|uniref:GMC oxidoreductase n=1 Tax=Reinekea sp. TaxID=1970455 RepID=UPI003989E5EA